MKFMNIFCLAIWIFQLVFGIIKIVNNEAVHPLIFICAVAICIIHYLAEIFK